MLAAMRYCSGGADAWLWQRLPTDPERVGPALVGEVMIEAEVKALL
jgi:hypothetical protein